MMPDYNAEVDYYEVLQVHPRAHREVIKRAYHTILGMLQAHPDLGGDHERAVLLNQAYAVLSNDESRKAYDEARHHRQRAAAPQTPPVQTASPRNGNAQTMLRCPRCRTRNLLDAKVDAHYAVCGKCGALLAPVDLPAAENEEIKLQLALRTRLVQEGELRLRRGQAPPDGRMRCRRCRYEWRLNSAHSAPSRCPQCSSRWWSHFRLFSCRFCGHQFASSTLLTLHGVPWACWPWPYWLFPRCPSCHHSRWHAGCERHLLRFVLNLPVH